ncbi:MAG: hypothetical protein JW888_08080 [Pirellulales bacterium]|nr:hypothetical protein [Pirellulales bacterium]
MPDLDPIAFDPKRSIQDDLDTRVAARLDRMFSHRVIGTSLRQWCQGVEKTSILLVEHAVLRELRLRHETESVFRRRPNKELQLRGVNFLYSFELGSVKGEGTLFCYMRLAGVDETIQKYHEKTGRIEDSLTVNKVFVRAEKTFKHFLPIAVDIGCRVVRAVNEWLVRQLSDLNSSAGMTALSEIRSLLKHEFRHLADQMLIYAYYATENGFLGTYVHDDQLFGNICDRLKKSPSNQIPRIEQIAAFLDARVPLEKTESRKPLAAGMPLPVTPINHGRLYEGSHQDLYRGEGSYFGDSDVISQPLVFADDIMNLQMVVCYPEGFFSDKEGGIPKRIENLKPKILDILKHHDLVGPLIAFMRGFQAPSKTMDVPQVIPAPEAGAIAAIKREICFSLGQLLERSFPTDDHAEVNRQFSEIHAMVMQCQDLQTLEYVKVLALKPEGLKTIASIRRVLDENSK